MEHFLNPEGPFEWICAILFVGAFLGTIYQVIKYRGPRNSMFGAKINRTLGEVRSAKIAGMNRKMLVHTLYDGDEDRNVGLELRASGAGNFYLTTMTLSTDGARELIELLERSIAAKSKE